MSWKSRATSKSWRAPPKNVELMPQHQDLGFQLLSRVSRAGIRLGSWESARARLVSPAQASLPRSWQAYQSGQSAAYCVWVPRSNVYGNGGRKRDSVIMRNA